MSQAFPWQTQRNPKEARLAFLKEKRGEAFACLERALFHADHVPKPEAISLLYDERPKDEPDYVTIICAIYSTAWRILKERRGRVRNAYLLAIIALPGEVIPDRDIDAIYKSGDHLRETFQKLMHSAEAKGDVEEGAEVLIDDLCDDWKGFTNMCRLLMDDIIHLSQRVHDFNATRRTADSLQLAVLGIGIAAAFSLLSLFSGLITNQAPKHSDRQYPGMPRLHL